MPLSFPQRTLHLFGTRQLVSFIPFSNRFINGIIALNPSLNAMNSISVVLKAVSVYTLDDHVTRKPA